MSDRGKKSYRIGVIGFAHMHVNELVDRFVATGRADIVACADTVPRTASLTTVEGSRSANLKRTLAAPGSPRGYRDYREMLVAEAMDIAILCPEISQHAEVAEVVARHGVHIVTEKPMAGSLADARRMASASRKAGVALAVNWPITWRPAMRRVKELLDGGAIGDVWEIKWRNGASLGPLAHGSTHPGDTVISGRVSDAEKAMEWWHQAEAGGGALLDYCCYGAFLVSWYLAAPPVSVQCLKANLKSGFGTADDNAAMLLRFRSAIAILEASWTTFHSGVANGPIIYGTLGTIVVDGADVLVYRERGATAPTLVEQGNPLPQGRATIAEEFFHHLETGEPLHPTLALPINLAAVAILDAGIRSAESGAAEPVATVQE
jgi:glucose-fructose oxidoreductase